MSNIPGTIPVIHDVDASGSFTINVPLQLPHCRFMPSMALAYHSAAAMVSALGRGWALKGASVIERVPRTKAQDGENGVVGYNKDDRFALDGLRLIQIADKDDKNRTEYRFEIEQWPVLSILCTYGGNTSVEPVLKHQREVAFNYGARTDVTTEYLGNRKIRTEQRLQRISCLLDGDLKSSYEIEYDYAPLTLVSRIVSIALGNAAKQIKVEPLKFTWSNAEAKVFDEIKEVVTLSLRGSNSLVTPMDVDAGGLSDLVLASTDQNEGKDELYLNIFLSDTAGKVENEPTSGSGFTGLPPAKQFLPFDANGDGQTDLLHISSSDTDEFSLTILLSDGKGFTKQRTQLFKPAKMDGSFHLGDFKLVYVYLDSGEEKQLKFVQFTTDGNQLTPGDVQAGPLPKEGVKLETFKVVVGDLDGDGSDDLFVFALSDANWMIYFIKSVKGKLEYQAADPLQEAGKAITYSADSTIPPFKADSDGKTSLVIASKSGENLQFQTLPSIRNLFLADQSPTATEIKYEGNIAAARVISQNTPYIVNFVQGASGPSLHVFRFSGDAFKEVPGVTQPSGDLKDSFVRWADLHGVGRTDCLFSTLGTENKLTVRSLQCTGSQPLDRILTSTNGLGAVTTVSYGPLTDPEVYSYESTIYKQATALTNSSANNVVSISALRHKR
ncbi:hypothetical protein CPB84DRAFT_1745995 [Gymnopilus junonius]|uniref:Uncharacterized protein n=1 Tax=Gymnopilus junonius TaxID=109634 RepID=A0A9P5NRB6_GYMJU|nr:hypothetical protein CPB84DRAFT_1745995 [Gymnopilus junonius]